MIPPERGSVTGGHPVVLFDGVCHLCDRTVRFLVRRDKRARLRFAALQSDVGQERLAASDAPDADLGTLVLIEADTAYIRSTAILRILRHVGLPWSLGYALVVVPRPLRDWAYGTLARRRYRLFGKRDACSRPPAKYAERFLD